MYYNHNLRSNLQEWRNRLYKSNYNTASNNYQFLLDKLINTAPIAAILQTTKDNYPLTKDEIIKYNDHFFGSYGSIGDYKFKSDEHVVSVLFHLLVYFQEQGYDGRTLMQNLVTAKAFSDSINGFGEVYVDPIINFIHDRLDESNNILYLLEKYKKRTEWFMHTSLISKYGSVANKQYEQVFEDDLRLYLFDQGIDNPFSTPKSSSGRADIIGLIDTKEPLVLEIKIFDSNKGYRKQRIIDGFAQVVKYTNDYNKNVGYLVVFNVDNIEIEIVGCEIDKMFPHRVLFNNKVYYIIFINLNFDTTASKTGTLKVESVAKEELTAAIV